MEGVFRDKTLLIRADGNERIGSGHLMRCFAIAQGYMRQGGRVVLLTAPGLAVIEERMSQAGITVIHLNAKAGSDSDLHETLAQSERFGAGWVILDGYHFPTLFHFGLKNGGKKVLLVDDHGTLDRYSADLILNQNIYANANMYVSKLSAGSLLMGCEFSCLRDEFQKWVGWKRPKIGTAMRIMITLGGADPDNVTLRVLQALKRLNLPELQVTAIAGAGNPHLESLKKTAENSPFAIEVLTNVQEMPVLISVSDIAISAGGSTCWELAFLGLPSLVIVMAENQTQVASKLAELGIAKNLGWHESVSEIDIVNDTLALIENAAERQKMSDLGQRLVDGKGTSRVIERMRAGEYPA